MNILVPHLLRRIGFSENGTAFFAFVFVAVLLIGGSLFGAEVTQTTVTLTWTAPGDDAGNGTASQYDIRYSSSLITGSNWASATPASGEPVPQSAGALETMTITGLQPGTVYYFAIKAADEVPNWSALSNVVSVTTLPSDPPPAAILTLSTNNVTSNSVGLYWLAPGADSITGTASTYDIRYSTSPIDDGNWGAATQVSGESSPQSPGSIESFTVNGLNSGVQFFFAIKTADAGNNWSGLSNVASTTTGAEQVAPDDISNFIIVSTLPNSVTLGWTASGDDGAVGTADRYEIRYAIWPITNMNWGAAAVAPNPPTPQAAGSPESHTVTGLISGATYYFAIKVADEVPNWSNLSNVVNTVTGDNIAPNPITDLAAIAGDNSGDLIISWTATGDDGMSGLCHHYIIAYSTDTITATNWQSASVWVSPPDPEMGGNNQEYTLDGLEEAIEYWVVLVAVDEANNTSGISNVASGESGFEFGTGADDDDPAGIPDEYELHQNFPNPFNPTTTIEYSVPEQSYVALTVYNIIGQKVALLIDGEKNAGTHTVTWDGTDDNGVSVTSGIYFYTIQTSTFRQSRKMVLMK
ncbi:MAG: fibronectin type III domain-containing protein [candidate division Zixibacteria bacterium]|nr:fibronectin type III domain-containing protein [candidate division Zixibacteria bacterium]